MSIPSALKLREMRGKPKKPVKAKLVLTLEQWAAIQLGLETLIFSALAKRPGVLDAAQGAQDEVKRLLKTLRLIDDGTGRYFETRADERGRKYLCSRCAYTSVVNLGDLCPSCSAPGAA